MGLKTFQIVYDNQYNTYYTGQTVSGRLIVSVDTVKKIRGLIISFKGEASVKWHETKTRRKDDGSSESYTETYSGEETYFQNKYNLIGGKSGELELPPGEHCYPFSTILPRTLPSSFEGEHGYVRYTVKAVLDRPWKFDQEVKSAFTVISLLDLNTHPTAKDPVKLEKEKHFCCLCCKSAPLTLILSLPYSGYVPGQNIPITVEVDNGSDINVTEVKCRLTKLIAFHATSPHSTKMDQVDLAELPFEPVNAGDSKTWTQQFTVPPLPPSNLVNCNLIDVDYELKVEARVSGPHKNPKLKTPIILGSIPLLCSQPVHGPGALPGPGLVPTGSGDIKVPTPGITPNLPGDEKAGGPGWNLEPTFTPGFGPNAPPSPYLGPGGTPTAPPPANQQDPGSSQPFTGTPTVPFPAGQPYPGAGQPYPGAGQPYPGAGQQYPGAGQQYPGAGQQYPGAGQPFPGAGQPYPGAGQPYPGAGQPYGPPTGATPVQPDATLYPSIPPPTYAESTFATKSIHDAGDNQFTHGAMQFAPRYPVYNFANK